MEVVGHSEKIMNFLRKFVDGTGKWTLKTALKESDKREIHHITEQLQLEMNSLEQAIQEGIINLSSSSSSSSSSTTSESLSSSNILKNAVLCHVSNYFNYYL